LIDRLRPTVLAAIAGGLAAAALLFFFVNRHPDVVLEFDRPAPGGTSGFWAPERAGDDTFAWTGPRASMRLVGVDRRRAWRCAVTLRGMRPAGVEQPRVRVAVDGVVVGEALALNEYRTIEVTAAPRDRPGVVVAVTSAPTFVPGGRDTRELGVQIDRLACAPAAALIWPPAGALGRSAMAGAIFAAALAVVGSPVLEWLGLWLLIAVGQATLLAAPAALYDRYADVALGAALWIGPTLAAAVFIAERWRGQLLSRPARLAATLSAVALFLQMLALLHPLKLPVDAVFHAHRLEWVMSGRYFFTQPMPDGVQFPYAIALYVVAMPFASLTSDHVLLLRSVVLVAQAVAGLCLYPLAARWWGSPMAGLLAVVLFHFVPLPWIVVGNANLTNAFGQSAALIASAAVTLMRAGPVRVAGVVLTTLIVAVALLSHVSTFALLGATLVALALWLAVFGGQTGRRRAAATVAATAIAATVSVAIYYGRFTDVYATALARVSDVEKAGTTMPPDPASALEDTDAAVRAQASAGAAARAWVALRQTTQDVGWPICALAVAGTALARGGGPLTGLIAAWALVWALGTFAVVATRVGPEFERYAIEFLGRINLATYPAAVLLAARAVSAAWEASRDTPLVRLARMGTTVLLVAAALLGTRAWLAWLQ
jgi:hypothetical protein